MCEAIVSVLFGRIPWFNDKLVIISRDLNRRTLECPQNNAFGPRRYRRHLSRRTCPSWDTTPHEVTHIKYIID